MLLVEEVDECMGSELPLRSGIWGVWFWEGCNVACGATWDAGTEDGFEAAWVVDDDAKLEAPEWCECTGEVVLEISQSSSEVALLISDRFDLVFVDRFLLRLTDCTAAVTNFSNSDEVMVGYPNSVLSIWAICLIFSSCSLAFLSLKLNLSINSSLLEENCFHFLSSLKFSCSLMRCVVPLGLWTLFIFAPTALKSTYMLYSDILSLKLNPE